MDHLRDERTYDLALRGVKMCKNCTHWMQDTCPNAPEVKWFQRKLDIWCKLSTCEEFSPNESTELALMHLTQRRMMGEDIRLRHDEDEE